MPLLLTLPIVQTDRVHSIFFSLRKYPPDPSPIAAAARAAGIIIYCIGLVGTDGIDVATLNDWATDPDASHVAVTPDAADLETLFADLAKNISKPGATNIVIVDKVNPDFEIVSVGTPTKGTA